MYELSLNVYLMSFLECLINILFTICRQVCSSANQLFSCSRGLPTLPPLPPSVDTPSDLYQVCAEITLLFLSPYHNYIIHYYMLCFGNLESCILTRYNFIIGLFTF